MDIVFPSADRLLRVRRNILLYVTLVKITFYCILRKVNKFHCNISHKGRDVNGEELKSDKVIREWR